MSEFDAYAPTRRLLDGSTHLHAIDVHVRPIKKVHGRRVRTGALGRARRPGRLREAQALRTGRGLPVRGVERLALAGLGLALRGHLRLHRAHELLLLRLRQAQDALDVGAALARLVAARRAVEQDLHRGRRFRARRVRRDRPALVGRLAELASELFRLAPLAAGGAGLGRRVAAVLLDDGPRGLAHDRDGRRAAVSELVRRALLDDGPEPRF